MSEHTRRTAGVPLGAYSDFAPGQRVMTVDGYAGRVVSVDEGPYSNRIQVVLDNGMGGGTYDDTMLKPLNERKSSVDRTASDDYPELGTILNDRPDLPATLAEREYLAGEFARRHRHGSMTKQADYYVETPESLALSQAAAELIGASNEAMYRVRTDAAPPQDVYQVVSQAGEVLSEHPVRVIGAAKVHCSTCGEDYFIDSEDEKHDHSKTAIGGGPDWSLSLPPVQAPAAEKNVSAGTADGLAQGRAGGAREPKHPEDAAYMVDFEMGWADGVRLRPPNLEPPTTDPSDLADHDLDIDKVSFTTSNLWDFIKGDDKPSKNWAGPGHNYSFDWCRFRKNSRCMYPKELNKAASEMAGYAVWVPEDRGYCPRVEWTDQEKCPVGEPGPHAPEGGFTDATVPWEEGGQRGGVPSPGYRAASLNTAAADGDSFSFHFTASWDQVRAKAKRIRSDGGVRVMALADGVMTTQVKGDHHTYQTTVTTVPGRYAVGSWDCGCPWAAYSWGRTGPWKKYEGRMCSHALASVYEAQSRGMFGKDVHEDKVAPAWVPKGGDVKVPGDWDKDLGAYTSAHKADDAWEIVTFLVATGKAISEIHPTVLSMAFDSGLLVASGGPLVGQVGGMVRDLFFDDGIVVDKATGATVPGPVLFPTYHPTLGLDTAKEARMGTEHWAMTFDDSAITSDDQCWGDNCYRQATGLTPQEAVIGSPGNPVPTCDRCHAKYTGRDQHNPIPKAAARSALDGAFALSIADLHDEPEPALPTTDGADDEKMEQARQALLRVQATPDEARDEDYTPEQRDLDPLTASTREAAAAQTFLAEAEYVRTHEDPHAWLMGGTKSEDVAASAKAFLASKTALKDFSAAERKSIIDEGDGVEAGNLGGLDLTGTHYQMMAAQRAKSQVDDSLGW